MPAHTKRIVTLGGISLYYVLRPSHWLCGQVFSSGNRNAYQIALTFDDGPNEPYTSQVLRILSQYGIRSTFFVIGQNVRRCPEVCRQAIAAGHVIGNHSYRHERSLFLKRGKAAAHELYLAHEAIYQSTGYEAKLFRPPHGYLSPWLAKTAHVMGYTIVTWDIITQDYEMKKPAKDIAKSIIKRTKPGSIIVLHDGRGSRESYDRSQMLEALPKIIELLKNIGFQFVTVSDLLKSANIFV